MCAIVLVALTGARRSGGGGCDDGGSHGSSSSSSSGGSGSDSSDATSGGTDPTTDPGGIPGDESAGPWGEVTVADCTLGPEGLRAVVRFANPISVYQTIDVTVDFSEHGKKLATGTASVYAEAGQAGEEVLEPVALDLDTSGPARSVSCAVTSVATE